MLKLSFDMMVTADVIDQEKTGEEVRALAILLNQTFEDLSEQEIIDDAVVQIKAGLYDTSQQEEADDAMERNHTAELLEKLQQMKMLQKAAMNNAAQEDATYMRGMHNGMELIIAMVENRDPVFIMDNQE